MRARLAQSLAEGASGFSTGLYYPPNASAPTDEVIAVAEALRGAGGIYVTHMRDEGDRVLDSIKESLQIGRAADVPVVISHHKCTAPENFGRSTETLPLIAAAAQAPGGRISTSTPMPRARPCCCRRRCVPTCRSASPGRCRTRRCNGRFLADIAQEWGVDQDHGGEAPAAGGRDLFPDATRTTCGGSWRIGAA